MRKEYNHVTLGLLQDYTDQAAEGLSALQILCIWSYIACVKACEDHIIV